MSFRRQPPDNDPAPDQNPLSPFNAPTERRERGGTQPLDDRRGGSPRDVELQADSEFSTRQTQRRLRQPGARVYPERIGAMARQFDSRQLFLIGGTLILLLLALLAYRAYSRRSTANTGLEAPARAGATASSAPQATAGLALPPAGAFVTVAPGADNPALNPPATSAAPPASGSGASFVVSGTGSAGLFLRPEPAATGQAIATLPDGTKVQTVGEPDVNDGTRTWKKVKTDKGTGWVAADFLIPAP